MNILLEKERNCIIYQTSHGRTVITVGSIKVKSVLTSNNIQIEARDRVQNKVLNGDYLLENTPCSICGGGKRQGNI